MRRNRNRDLVGRDALVIVVAVALLGVWFGSFLFEELEFCRDALAQVGELPVVRICGPASVSDLAVGWVTIGVLMLPEISELVIAGVVSFKRQR